VGVCWVYDLTRGSCALHCVSPGAAFWDRPCQVSAHGIAAVVLDWLGFTVAQDGERQPICTGFDGFSTEDIQVPEMTRLQLGPSVDQYGAKL
jgi:hypothetical protein